MQIVSNNFNVNYLESTNLCIQVVNGPSPKPATTRANEPYPNTATIGVNEPSLNTGSQMVNANCE